MAKEQYLLDEDFLIELDNLQIRCQVARITVLDFNTESRIEDITGRITSGNISVNSDSAVRRTANLTFVIDDVSRFNLFKINNLLSINKKIKLEVGIENITNKYIEEDYIWFPQGVYIIAQNSVSYSTSGITASLQLKDKMCLLNGEFGGVFPAQTRLDKVYEVDSNGIQIVSIPTIYQIIKELVCHFGGEKLGKIIINDIGELTYQTMRWGSTDKLYIINDHESYIFTLDEQEAIQATKNDDTITYYTYEEGDEVCYAPTEFTYPDDLIASSGSCVTAVLDTIKTKLGNFEYFYDLEGNFVFQEIKNYLNTSQATLINADLNKGNENAYYLSRAKGKSTYSFVESPLVSSYSINPNYINIKNDFLIWGTKKGDDKCLIRYHLAIDEKPDLINFPEVYVYKNGDGLIAAQVPYDITENDNITYINDYGFGSAGIIYRIEETKALLEYQKKVLDDWVRIENGETIYQSIEMCYAELKQWDKKKDYTLDFSDEIAAEEADESITDEQKALNAAEREKKQNAYPNLYFQDLYRKILALRPTLKYDTVSKNFAALLHYNKSNNKYISFYYWDEINGKFVDVTNTGELYLNYKPKDWRTVLYLQGSLATPYGTDSNYYYVELKNEWPKIYDLRPEKIGGYTKKDAPWNLEGQGQDLYPLYKKNPELMEYFLDFINPDSTIGEFNVTNIGRRQKVETVQGVNCVFSPINLSETVAIEKVYKKEESNYTWKNLGKNGIYKKSYKEMKTNNIWKQYSGTPESEINKINHLKEECLSSGRLYSIVDTKILNILGNGLVYRSAFESIRSNLNAYTTYAESLSITIIPIFHLQPNTRISIVNKNLNVSGDYLLKSYSIPLGSGTMTLQTNKITEKI